VYHLYIVLSCCYQANALIDQAFELTSDIRTQRNAYVARRVLASH